MAFLDQLLIVYGTYIVATASPGPSNLAIMGAAMAQGRAAGLTLAAGVVCGSMFWAVLAATGISAVLAQFAEALFLIKIAGGLYLLFLAWKSGRSALRRDPISADRPGGAGRPAYRALYRRGLLMHLANPKAVLAWIAIMSLGLQPGAPAGLLQAIVGGCAVLGVLVFGGYAILFSTDVMVAAYARARRWIEGALALLFGYAGFRLLTARI
ncbi:LysE family translocator [Hwanghaeella sp.]|uniref:LysE family translocator n=1 Tax=Hwanghaeella sp. TaxID=2605943 RepID=UPI003CCB977C